MNMRQAKAYVLHCLAAEARHHIANDSEWLNMPLSSDGIAVDDEGRFLETDRARVIGALRAIANELDGKAQRMRATERP